MSADLSLDISMRGNQEELAAMLKVLRLFETEKRDQYRDSGDRGHIEFIQGSDQGKPIVLKLFVPETSKDDRDCGYIDAVQVKGNDKLCYTKNMTDEEIAAFVTEAGEELTVTASGPWGTFSEPSEVGLYETLADAAPGAWFNGHISGCISGEDVAHSGELKDGVLHLYDYMVCDDEISEMYVNKIKKKLSRVKFCKFFSVDKEEFDSECYDDFLMDALDFGFPNDMDYDSFLDLCDSEIEEDEFEDAIEKVRALGIEDFDTFRETLDESKFTTRRTYHPNDPCNKCEGITFVITGKLSTFKNRDVLVSYVERQGGKVTGSISKNTNYLVNNDANSDSSKNKKAKELNIPIITEAEFVEKFGC